MQWIFDNKEWIFSGIGVLFLSILFGLFVRSRGKKILKQKSDKNSQNYQAAKDIKKEHSAAQTTSGANSPIVNGQVAAARDVHITVTPSSIDTQDREVFTQLEDTVPDVLQELREALKEDPLIRDIIYLERKNTVYNWSNTHLLFSEDEHKNIGRKLQFLMNAGMIQETKEEFAYRISERLARYLK